MTLYIIVIEFFWTDALITAVREIGGKPIHPSCWIAPWSGDADSLCSKLRRAVSGRVVVSRLDSDWSYR